MKYAREKISLSGQFSPSTVFLAEGKAEWLFIDKVLKASDASMRDCVVFLLEGYTGLENKIRLLLWEENSNNISSLGIMLDANNVPDQRLRKAANALKRAGFPSNENELRDGGICADGARRTSVFLSPGQGRKGRIEDLIIEEIRTTDLFDCVSGFKACVEGVRCQIDDKGVVQTYISARAGDLCGVGRAFQKGVLDINHDAYRTARIFVQNLL